MAERRLPDVKVVTFHDTETNIALLEGLGVSVGSSDKSTTLRCLVKLGLENQEKLRKLVSYAESDPYFRNRE